MDIPKYQVEPKSLCLLQDILSFYESKEGQMDFKEWKAKRDREKTIKHRSYDHIRGGGHQYSCHRP